MEQSFIASNGLVELLNHLEKDYSIFVPEKRDSGFHYVQYRHNGSSREGPVEGDGTPCLGEIRSCEPLKAFYFTARKTVAVDFDDSTQNDQPRPLCIVGAKACDLKSLGILDGVFMDASFTDPFYARARREHLIIASDCTNAAGTCFCTALDGTPHPTDTFDLNLSEVDGGYVVDIGSEKGSELAQRYASLFTQPSPGNLSERDRRREQVADQVRANVTEHGVPNASALVGMAARTYESEMWKEEAETCVECGACNTVCPTCHCFLLYDQQRDGKLKRYRLWDSCLIKDFAEVAGGANPRPHLWMRLRNRFEKKFDYFPSVKDVIACTGCGRCINACPGKIDIRSVLKRSVQSVSS
jgi:ferredoxin